VSFFVRRKTAINLKLTVLIVVFGCIDIGLTLAKEPMPWPPAFTHSKIAVTPGRYHATIRGSIRLVFPHQGKWLAFRGGPDAYHFSENGVTWTATEAPKPAAVTSLRGTSSTHFTLCLSNRSPNGFSIALSVEEPSQRWKYGGEHRTNWIRRSVTTLIYSRTRMGFYHDWTCANTQ